MIDYLKIFVKDQDLIHRLNNNPLLEWSKFEEGLSHIVNEAREGILKASISKVFKGVLFCFKEGKKEIKRGKEIITYSLIIYFKPHYYFNNNQHNANDFSFEDCQRTITAFLKCLAIDDYEDKMYIQNIEYGLNVVSPIKIEDLISFFAYHVRNEFKTDRGLSYSKKSSSVSKKGKESKYQIIKAYAKGLQFPKEAHRDTLRFEINSHESKKINQLTVYTLKDLQRPDVYIILANDIIKRFDEILILDHSVKMENLNPKNRLLLAERLNSYYWYQQLQKSRNTFANSKISYFKLLDKTGFNIHKELKKTFLSKIEELKNCAYSDTLPNTINCAYSDIYIIRNCTMPELGFTRRCIFTGDELEVPEKEIKGKGEEEVKVKAYIENYTAELYKRNLEDPEYITAKGKGKGKYYWGEDVEIVIQRTFAEVKEIFKTWFETYNFVFDCRQQNYFYNVPPVVGWRDSNELLNRFQLTFYISRKAERKKKVRFQSKYEGRVLRLGVGI